MEPLLYLVHNITIFIVSGVIVIVVNAKVVNATVLSVVFVINMTQAGLGKHQGEVRQEEAGQEHLHPHQEQLQDLLLLPPGDHFEIFINFTSWCSVELINFTSWCSVELF